MTGMKPLHHPYRAKCVYCFIGRSHGRRAHRQSLRMSWATHHFRVLTEHDMAVARGLHVSPRVGYQVKGRGRRARPMFT